MRAVQAAARALAVIAVTGAALSLAPSHANAAWQPGGIEQSSENLDAVLAAAGPRFAAADASPAERRERWTYVNGERRFAVRVAVKGADYRVDVTLPDGTYSAGRLAAVPWRSDANGVAHATYSEAQGDAVDRVPRSVFAVDRRTLRISGRTRGAAPAWVVEDAAPNDKPHWFYIDPSSGDIVREVVREGARTIVTAFDRFEPADGVRRPRHWHVSDGNRGNDIDVTVDEIVPQHVGDDAVALPKEERVFAPLAPSPAGRVTLPAHFDDNDTIVVDVQLDGRPMKMVLDTGTASITLDTDTARELHANPVLEHATIPLMTVGGIGLSDVSVLTIPFRTSTAVRGILGLDFFFGHVVHIDYAKHVVDVLTPEAAAPVFHDPAISVVPAAVGEGLPLVRASFGPAGSARFAVDTGSSQLYVFDAFERRWEREIAAHWSPATFADGRRTQRQGYLEGPIQVAARRAASFEFGPTRFRQVVVGVEVPDGVPDAIAIPLDGIIGTDELEHFELWFDYDNQRLALRPNGS